MILEGFEIENWSCIRRIAVDNLPAQGVAVLHGPNGTGKSSIVAAIRACLLDYPSGSTAQGLKRWFPVDGARKPRVSVRFRARGVSWRITKQFGSRESRLESLTPSGDWKAEATTAAEAHERTQELAGASKSDAGLHQLLWLTQAEFRLPEPKDFDRDVQSRLRAVLGVLQTPLDDRFLTHVRDRRSQWFTPAKTAGQESKKKKDSSLTRLHAELEDARSRVADLDREFADDERLMTEVDRLETATRSLRQQCLQHQRAVEALQLESQQAEARLNAHKLAVERLAVREKARADAHELSARRADAAQRLVEAERNVEQASENRSIAQRSLTAAEAKLRSDRDALAALRQAGSDIENRLAQLSRRRDALVRLDQARLAADRLQQAEETAEKLECLKSEERERPAPDASVLRSLAANRASATKRKADVQAAAMTILLRPNAGAPDVSGEVDGSAVTTWTRPDDGAPIGLSVRRRAALKLPGWGQVEVRRGADESSLEDLEAELATLNSEYRELIAPFGLSAEDASAVESMHRLAAEREVRSPELKRLTAELKRLAPKGIDVLREEAAKLNHAAQAAASAGERDAQPPPADSDLERLAGQLEKELAENRKAVAAAQRAIAEQERAIDGQSGRAQAVGLRQCAEEAGTRHASLKGAAEAQKQALERMLTAEQIQHAVERADAEQREAQAAVASTRLTESEQTVGERLDAAHAALKATRDEQTRTLDRVNVIKGALSRSEGLHQNRAQAAARVEELRAHSEREDLESRAFDLLFTLFEECRQKQLGAVMGPIHDRVARWMRLLRIGEYRSIRFNDQFLPEALVGNAEELAFDHESAGTIEQLGLMVRLALGATLSTDGESAVAILDDPLTHSDVSRLNMMRAVLRSASEGDPESNPPAGPLQMLVFTCHPEWFSVGQENSINLADQITR